MRNTQKSQKGIFLILVGAFLSITNPINAKLNNYELNKFIPRRMHRSLLDEDKFLTTKKITENELTTEEIIEYDIQEQTEQEIIVDSEIQYTIEPKKVLLQNILLSGGFTDTTHFSNPAALDNGLRDSHVIDAYNGVVVWSWTDNSTVANKTNGTMNVMIVVGNTNDKGKLSITKPINLTNFKASGFQAWDTAVAINRMNPKNIVVSYLLINYNNGTALPYRAVSLDGGMTWKNGPMNILPTGTPSSVGDNRGVASDKYGNIWYLATNLYNTSGKIINQPYFSVSIDGGITFKRVFDVPLLSNFKVGISEYDYPQFCFGGLGDGSKAYGLWFVSDYYQNGQDITPLVGFLPIHNFNSFGTGNTIELNNFKNTQYVPCLTAAQDGRVWCEAINYSIGTTSYPVATRFKSPGLLNANYAGPWNVSMVDAAFANGVVHETSNQLVAILMSQFRAMFTMKHAKHCTRW